MNGADPLKPLLQIKDLVVEFPAARRRKVHAVSGVSLEIAAGETLGLVGESGCGKSSLARAVMQAPPPSSGKVWLDGVELTAIRGAALREQRANFQMVFQDPLASLNPVKGVGESVELPLRTAGRQKRYDVEFLARQAFSAVGLDPEQHYSRKPARLSGGQCQRVCIARALISSPKLLVCDEPVSSLDVSVQAQIINLLRDLKESHGLSMLFISHDLAVVRNIADRVAVMYLGRLCEVAPCAGFFLAPAHPYSRTLIASVPRPDPRFPGGVSSMLAGELPSPLDPPTGCRFRTRCPQAQPLCAEMQPELREIRPGHLVACHFPQLNSCQPRMPSPPSPSPSHQGRGAYNPSVGGHIVPDLRLGV
ncbi:MAG: peptide ABC transporter ATP-binding protein [Geobacteraceae bacterium GWC2_58_44]|nr:MAG: peptide ABC transporter ATP-binding protein [Geobacteraceae bacterium GWC2_58_44]HBG05963.1 peptide ABC transporter ATP-binding protein [Geobacter sp.]